MASVQYLYQFVPSTSTFRAVQPTDVTKTRNGLENGLANGLEGTCLKRSFGHRNPLYNEHTT